MLMILWRISSMKSFTSLKENIRNIGWNSHSKLSSTKLMIVHQTRKKLISTSNRKIELTSSKRQWNKEDKMLWTSAKMTMMTIQTLIKIMQPLLSFGKMNKSNLCMSMIIKKNRKRKLKKLIWRISLNKPWLFGERSSRTRWSIWQFLYQSQ